MPKLGEDDSDFVASAEATTTDKAETTAEGSEQPTKPDTQDTDELKIIKQKAALLDMIDQDPELSNIVLAKLRGEKPATQTTKTDTSPEKQALLDLQAEIKAQRDAVARMKAQMEIERFAADKPDFNQHKEAMGRLILKHPTLSLDDAYSLVTRSKASGNSGKSSQLPEGKPLAKPTVKANSLRDASKHLYDELKPKSFDETFDAAVKLAKSMHENTEED